MRQKILLIRDCMATDLVTLSPHTDITLAAKILLDEKISGAPVLDSSGTLVGVLSKKDCLRAALNAAYFQDRGGPVSNFMSTSVETLDADLDIVAAAEAFLKSIYRRFPVLENGRLVGQVSRYDLLKGLTSGLGKQTLSADT